MNAPQLNNRWKSNATAYLPLICILVTILGYLVSIAGPWWSKILLELYQFKFKLYYVIVIMAGIVSLLASYLRHQSWRYFFPLVLPVLVVYIVLYNVSSSSNWITAQQDLSITQLISEIKRDPLIKTYQEVKEYVKGKKVVISPYYNFFRDTRFENIVDAEIVLKEYPYVLSEDEFAALMEKPLITKEGHYYMPNLISWLLEPDGEVLKSEKIYAFSYRKHLFLIPEEYFLRLKGLTKTDLDKYKEKK